MQNNNEAMGQQRKGEFNKKDVKKERLLHGRFELSTFRLHKLVAYETDALPTELVKHLNDEFLFLNAYMTLMFSKQFVVCLEL